MELLKQKMTQESYLDVDWFGVDIHGHVAIVASGGGMIPTTVSSFREKWDSLSVYFRSLPKITDIVIQPAIYEKISSLDAAAKSRYLKDVELLTSKGLYYFDKSDLSNYFNFEYYLKARPVLPLQKNQISADILRMISNTRIEINFNLDDSFFVDKVS